MNLKARFIFKFKQVSATFIRTSRTYCILRGLCLSVTGALEICKTVITCRFLIANGCSFPNKFWNVFYLTLSPNPVPFVCLMSK